MKKASNIITIIALLLDANTNVFQKIKEHIKPEDFKDETNRKTHKYRDVCPFGH